ncbi:MAG TPA: hypothetical protein VE693_05860 [Gaiellaceae bacterium]|jgi:hypothetical protein|nr:hypothetical protein [Gaiellaceae bacterium]
MTEPGLDRHEWETEWAELEPDLEDSPAEALPELGDLIARMLAEAGYPVDTEDPVDDEGIDPEILASFQSAREITRQVDRGEDFDPGDVAQAIDLYREIYAHLVNREVDLS